jgi:hypothetical protein
MKTYRRIVRHEQDTLTVAKYSPPLTRNGFEELRDVVELADCDAEICEVVFKGSGKRVLLACQPRVSDGGSGYWQDYTEVEPGEYLAYDHADRELLAMTDEYLQQHYEEEEGSTE